MPSGISYVISLNSRQFFDELRKVKQEANRAAKEIEGEIGGAGAGADKATAAIAKMGKSAQGAGDAAKKAASGLGALKNDAKSANDAMKTFNSAASAFSKAMSGDFVGAAVQASNAMKGLTTAMAANPVLLMVTAVVALTAAVYKAARAWSDYRDRIRDAETEHLNMLNQLDAIQSGASSVGDMRVNSRVAGFSSLVSDEKDMQTAQELRDAQAQEVERRRQWAEQKAQDVTNWAKASGSLLYYQRDDTGKMRYGTKGQWQEEAQAAYEAAQESLEEAVATLNKYDEILNGTKSANEAEAQRLKEGKATDTAAMQQLADQMAKDFDDRFGAGSLASYEDRVAGGGATQEEIEAYRKLEEYRRKVAESAEREAEREQASAKESAAAEEQLARERERVMVLAEDTAGLEELLAQKRKEFAEQFAGSDADNLANATKEELAARSEILRIEKELAGIKDAEAQKAQQAADKESRKKEQEEREQKQRADRQQRWEEGRMVAKMTDAEKEDYYNEKIKTLRAGPRNAETEEQMRNAIDARDAAQKAQEATEQKKQDFLHRNDTDAQRLARNSEELKKAMEAGDTAKALDLMLEGEQLAENYREPMSRSEMRRAEKKAKRDEKAAMRAARAYRRQVANYEKEFAAGTKSEDEINAELSADNASDPTKRKVMKGGKLTIETGGDLTNRLLTEIRDALQ